MNFGRINTLTTLTIIAFIYYTNAVGIDDKLDFGGRRKSHSSFINDGIHKNPFGSLDSRINVDAGDDLDSIGVVCVNEGCSSTTTKSTEQSGDTINTDVVLHIKTKVNLNQNKTKPIDDTPDIPVVVGTDNSNSNNYDGIRTEPKSVFIPDDDGPRIFQNTRPHTQGSKIYQSGPQYGSGMSFYPYQLNSKLDSATFYQNMLNPKPEVNINFRSLPPIAMDVTSDLLTTNFKASGIEMSVPYFDPSLHSHHYSETPPPQYVFYPKQAGIMNPVEFKVMRPNWTPSQWQNQFNQHKHGALPTGTVKCFCENDDGRTDLHLYPGQIGRSSVYSPTRRDSVSDPGAQINHKLAPLN